MLHNSTMTFLTNLANNNNREWFEANKPDFESAKKNMEETVGELLKLLGESEPGFKEQHAKDCIFRIYRDVRFSKNKAPYKANFGAFFSKGGKKYNGAGYYIHIEPGQCFAGGGLWMPQPDILKAVRQEIDYNFTNFNSIIEEKKFKKTFSNIEGEQLKNLPKGYDANNPAAKYLKFKSYTVISKLSDSEVTDKKLIKNVMNIFQTMKPMIDFINKAVD